MKLTHILGRTWAIEGNGITGLYRLDSDKCILIDSGLPQERQDLMAALTDEGLIPVGVVSTHIHIDHCGNNGWLRKTYGTVAAAPAGEVCYATSPLALKGYMYSYSPDVLAKERGEMCHNVDSPIPTEDGEFFFCSIPFRVIHTPGHSLDHVSVITPDNVCCVGDAVLSGDPVGFKLPYALSIAMMMDSAQRLRGTDCAAYLVCHRGICESIDPVIDGTCNLFRQRADEIRSLVDRPMTWEELWIAVNNHFSLLSSQPGRAAKMERNLRSFVDYLVDGGELKLYAQNGILYLSTFEEP